MKKESTKKRIWLTALAAVSLGALFGSCKDEFDEVLGICPEVESTNPATDAIGVALNKTITVTFNEALNPASVVPGAFSLRVINTSGGIAEEIAGELTYQAETKSMNFKPSSDLSPNTTYTGRVEPVVKDMMGNALQAPYVWTFTTGVSPTVISTDPANLASGVALDKSINATFSMAMDSLSITATSFTLMNGTTPVTGVISYSGNTASFKPSVDLLPGTTYKGSISTEVKNKDGIPLAVSYNWTFNTGTAPTVISIDPKDLAIAVPANKAIIVTFSELMNAATINASTFTVKIGNVPVAGTVTYSESSAVFTPMISLLSNTTYSVTVSNLVKNPVGISMANDFVSTFTTGNFAIPKVVSTDPVNNATAVAINKVIKATFSEAMNPATISGSSFTIKQGSTNVPGTVTYSGTTATFTPTNPLSSNLVYTGTITTDAKNTAGTAMANNFVWTFTTAAIVAPTVSSTDPGNNATNVALNKAVKATFSEAMNPATITGATFTLKQGTTNVPGTVTYSGTTATFTPTNPLSPSLVYTGTITTDAKNAAGTGLANNFVWSFTTAALNVPTVNSTDPANNATDVAMNKVIKAVFNEAMNPATITGTTFTVKQGNTAVAGTVTYAGTTATFTPTNPLSPSLVYTGTITTGAKNAAGTGIASNYVWSFTTVASIAPMVVSTDPAKDATGVPINKLIRATFSQAMNPATITGTTFTVKQGANAVSGIVSYSGTTATFTPNNPLAANLVYTATITIGAKNVDGTPLSANYVWNFTTAANVAPTVVSTDPANNATNVALNKVVNATFSEAMNPATITGATFTVKQGQTVIAGTVTYSGTTASFTPSNPLSGGLVYTGTISGEAKNAAGTGLANNYVWNFTTVPNVAPTVVSTDPANNATNVALNKVVKAKFSEAMNPATITGATFIVKQGQTPVAGTVTYSGTTASFTPTNPLSGGLVYTGTITTEAKNAAGTGLANNFVWTFTTAPNVAPTVVSTDPANNATNVALNKVVNATFSEAMNPATITGATFTLKQGQTAVAGTVTYNGTTASFTPTNPLTGGLVYTGTITTDAKNAAGTGLANNYVWTFTTGAVVAPTVVSTDPANNATNVALNKVVNATFSEAMNPATITGATFTVKQGQTAVAGTVTYSGTTASFTPTNPLTGGLVYTGTITTDAKNAAGTGLANNYVWTFTTIAPVAPTVVSTDPANGASNVALNKVVNATFSEAMNPATITGATFTVKQGQTVIAGTVTYSGTTASFTPTNPLSGGLFYTATITTEAKNTAGTGLANNYVWNFTTAANVAPTVVSTDPANNATNVALNKVVNATFSEAMNPATITGATFTLKQGQTAVAGTVTYSGTTASFTPTNPLTGGLVYTGTITTEAKNAAGTGLANNYIWTFTTAVPVAPTVLSTDPANNATNVALNKVVNATFSEAMNPATITGATFTLKQGQTAIAGNVTYNGTTASFTPNVPLLPGLTYTGTITTEARNAAGTGLANNYVWSFTTVAPIAPTVLNTDPMNNATNVARNKVVRATFSIPMDATSINGNTFTLQLNGANVAGMVSYSGTTASFTPTALLSANQVYTATITNGARSATGTNLVNDYVWSFRVENPISAYFVDLKSAGRFGIFAATGISNNAGFSEIRNLDVGITPGVRTSVTGFPPALVVNGAIYASDDASPVGVAAMLIQAKSDLLQAYLFAEGASSPAPATVAGDQGGKTLAPGIYKSNSTLLIQAGDLTLDAQGDPNAVWIFQIASGFTTVGGSGGNVILTGGAQAKNIFWQVGSSATIGDNTNFKGNVLALTSITMNSGAKIVGRMLVLNGAVVMTNSNIIEKP